MEKEVWKTIPGYPEHEASTHKRIRHGNKILSTYIGSNDYDMVCICYNKKKHQETLHRLLALTFIPNPNNYPCVGHWDDNRRNNDLSNLYWTTYKENNNHNDFNKKVAKAMSVPVTMRSKDGKEEYFDGCLDAHNKTGINRNYIANCCKGKRDSVGDMTFEYSRTLF